MPNVQRNFIKGRMNKSVDERLVPNGEYVDAMNVRLGSTEDTEIGSVENSKGNSRLTDIEYNSVKLSATSKCIGVYEDGARETIYWMVTDSNFAGSTNTNKLDLIMSFNIVTSLLTYHIISIDDGGGANTTLNFNEQYLITGIDMVDNFLFFTDDYNAPRKINITKNYDDPSPLGTGTDQFSAEDILVIKAPPPMGPTWSYPGVAATGGENYLEDRFICFAYRYKYEDGEYSATSQFSEIAFSPLQFAVDTSSFLNGGMMNKYNQVEVSFNTGGPLVKSVDLLFKEADNGIIRVIENFNKLENGWANNVDKTYLFNHYIDGYNLTDASSNPIKLNYEASLITNEITITDIASPTIVAVSYSLLSPYSSDAGFEMDLSPISLSEGAVLFINLRFIHDSFQISPSTATPPVETTDNIDLSFGFTLQQTYSSVHEMVTSSEFIDAIGSAVNIQPMSTSCVGTTFTDNQNCSLPLVLGAFSKDSSGISATGEAINIISTIGSDIVRIELVAALYKNGAINLFEYYKLQFVDVSFQNATGTNSLHSDRDYEVGMVYMDDFSRATTALVSTFNTIHVPCGNSTNQNKIKVMMPVDMLAPSWAKRYKFVLKQDLETYETIYSQFFVPDLVGNEVWLLLEGENAAKVQDGSRLKVKTDSTGPLAQCVWTTVLEKKAQPKDFAYDLGSLSGVQSPAGIYIKLNPNNFSAIYSDDAVIDLGKRTIEGAAYPEIFYAVNSHVGSGVYEDFDIPVGSTIDIYIELSRQGKGNTSQVIYRYDKIFTSTQTWDNFYDWWIGEQINITTGDCPSPSCNSNVFDPQDPLGSGSGLGLFSLQAIDEENQYMFQRDLPAQNALALYIRSGTESHGSNVNKHSFITMHIQVFRRNSLFVFETEPQDTSPDIFYEGSKSYFIDANGYHLTTNPNSPSNVDQDATTEGEVFLEFFNCFAFGNGVESYKIEDSMVGKSFTLGNRVTAVSAQDYKEADRFADITYSGVYNDESNVNKLNEFNLGLANFFPLEESYGDIQILSSRATDILTLQEDKISYVTVGKNILTDAVGGGTVTSVPQVLGQQVARQDAFGISNNPESFVIYGYNKFFTDSKRGAVLQLKGSAGSNEQLNVISEVGLRSWFRNLFIDYPNTQKLGGFDPYMNEYVLSSNETELPSVEKCIECGIFQTLDVPLTKPYTFCVEYGTVVGTTSITYNITGIADISVTYNGVTTSTGNVTGAGSLSFSKSLPGVTTGSITITPNAADATVEIQALCPAVVALTVIQVCVSANAEAFQSIHNQYLYTDGAYVSPTHSTGVILATGTANPLVSQYASLTGGQGDAASPTNGSTVSLIYNKLGGDSYVFDTLSDKFRYLRTNTLYANTPGDIQTLLNASTQALPLITSFATSQYSADFTMPAGTDAYLYLIWDYRNSVEHGLCYDAASSLDVCCVCTHHWYLMRNAANASEEYYTQSPVALVIGTYYSLIGMGTKCFEVISTTTTLPTQHIDTTCTP